MSAAIYRAWHNWATDDVLDIDIATHTRRPELHPACEAALYLAGVPMEQVFRVVIFRDYVMVHYYDADDDGRFKVLDGDVVRRVQTVRLVAA